MSSKFCEWRNLSCAGSAISPECSRQVLLAISTSKQSRVLPKTMEWLHLRRCLVPFSRRARRTTWDCCWPWGVSSPPTAAAPDTQDKKSGYEKESIKYFAPNLNLSRLGGKFCYTRLSFLLDRREPSAGRATCLLFFNVARQAIEPSLPSLVKNHVFQNSWKKILQNASYLASHQTSNFLLFDYILWL